ncbi:MAG: TetR/AcrR family transcriptional regulator, partial [Aestuariivirga sp.]|nr:TetR/AcrR family transcriptional regulator [Aestuariivirga sp.]
MNASRELNFCTDPNNIKRTPAVNDFLRIGTKMSEKARGRPRAYDPEVALWRALETFWANGFSRTSLDALAAATGMNR